MNGRARSRSARTTAAVVAVALTQTVGLARAQSDNRAAAEALFREARKLLDAGNYAAACEKLASSERLEPAVGTLLNLARCYEKLGQTATAWATYREAVAAAKRAHQGDREAAARRAADALEPTLPRMTIVVSPQSDGAKPDVTRDGVPVLPDLWGVTVPVDPGEHAVSAASPGKKPWQTRVAVESGSTKSVTVPMLEATAPPERSADNPSAPSSPAKPSPHDELARVVAAPEQGSSWNGQRTVAVVLVGVALAGGTVALVEGLDYGAKKSQADSLCPVGCKTIPDQNQAVSLLDDARTASIVAIVAGSVGGAAAVAGCVLWLTAGTGSRDAGSLRWTPTASASGLGMSLSGTW